LLEEEFPPALAFFIAFYADSMVKLFVLLLEGMPTLCLLLILFEIEVSLR
jgi:hypothetical protein